MLLKSDMFFSLGIGVPYNKTLPWFNKAESIFELIEIEGYETFIFDFSTVDNPAPPRFVAENEKNSIKGAIIIENYYSEEKMRDMLIPEKVFTIAAALLNTMKMIFEKYELDKSLLTEFEKDLKQFHEGL